MFGAGNDFIGVTGGHIGWFSPDMTVFGDVASAGMSTGGAGYSQAAPRDAQYWHWGRAPLHFVFLRRLP